MAHILEGTARYVSLPSSCGGLPRPAEAFFALRAVFAYFWQFLEFSKKFKKFREKKISEEKKPIIS